MFEIFVKTFHQVKEQIQIQFFMIYETLLYEILLNNQSFVTSQCHWFH